MQRWGKRRPALAERRVADATRVIHVSSVDLPNAASVHTKRAENERVIQQTMMMMNNVMNKQSYEALKFLMHVLQNVVDDHSKFEFKRRPN